MTCFNCGTRCEELHPVPEFDFQGCDQCLAECQAVIASEAAEAAPAPISSAAADFLNAFPTGRPRFRGTFGPHYASIGNGIYVRTGERKTKRRAF